MWTDAEDRVIDRMVTPQPSEQNENLDSLNLLKDQISDQIKYIDNLFTAASNKPEMLDKIYRVIEENKTDSENQLVSY